MSRLATLAIFAFLFLGAPTPAAPLPSASPGSTTSPLAAKKLSAAVVEEVNRVRTARGLRPLRPVRSLTAAARHHSKQMGYRGFFEHASADGTPFWRRIERFYGDRGYRSWEVGENIFWESPATVAASSVIRSWLASPGHRENMLSRSWRDVGVGAFTLPAAPGVYGGSQVTIVTIDFGKRLR